MRKKRIIQPLSSSRLGFVVLLAWLLGGSFSEPPLSHEGHQHGAPEPELRAKAYPRVAVQSEAYELVAILQGERLAIYLDRFATNEPVSNAKITVTLGGDEERAAENAPEGIYTLTSPRLTGAGPLELIFAVTSDLGDDLLVATLHLPQAAEAGRDHHPDHPAHLHLGGIGAVAALVFAVGLGLGLLGLRRGQQVTSRSNRV